MRRDNVFGDLPEPTVPAVIGPDDATGNDVLEEISDAFVFVPAHPGQDKDEDTIRFELRQMSGGQPAILAFTSAEQLVGQLGEAQPWLSMPMDRLQALTQIMGVESICVNPTVEPDSGRWTEDDLRLMG